MNPTLESIDQKIDMAQEISISVLLGLFSTIIFAVSLAMGIAGAMIIIGFTGLKLSVRYTVMIIAIAQGYSKKRPGKSYQRRSEDEPIILGAYNQYRPVANNTTGPRRYTRKVSKTFVQRHNLYVPFAG